MTDFFTTYFAEKNLEERIYEVEGNETVFGTTHMIPTAAVIERLHATKGEERKQAEAIIRKIDCLNGDLHHFLRHLAEGMAKQF